MTFAKSSASTPELRSLRLRCALSRGSNASVPRRISTSGSQVTRQDANKTHMRQVTEEEVVEIVRLGHTGPPAAIAGTIARVVGHGPFERITLFGPTIGRLKFQPPGHDRQCSL